MSQFNPWFNTPATKMIWSPSRTKESPGQMSALSVDVGDEDDTTPMENEFAAFEAMVGAEDEQEEDTSQKEDPKPPQVEKEPVREGSQKRPVVQTSHKTDKTAKRVADRDTAFPHRKKLECPASGKQKKRRAQQVDVVPSDSIVGSRPKHWTRPARNDPARLRPCRPKNPAWQKMSRDMQLLSGGPVASTNNRDIQAAGGSTRGAITDPIDDVECDDGDDDDNDDIRPDPTDDSAMHRKIPSFPPSSRRAPHDPHGIWGKRLDRIQHLVQTDVRRLQSRQSHRNANDPRLRATSVVDLTLLPGSRPWDAAADKILWRGYIHKFDERKGNADNTQRTEQPETAPDNSGLVGFAWVCLDSSTARHINEALNLRIYNPIVLPWGDSCDHIVVCTEVCEPYPESLPSLPSVPTPMIDTH